MAKNVNLAPEYNIIGDEKQINPSYLPFFYLIFNYMIFWGGRGSGKSKVIAQILVSQTTTIKRNIICMRKQATDCRNSCFAEIYKVIYEFKLQDVWEIRENPDMRMYNKVTESEIIFTGMDKVENIKSLTFKRGNATDLWYEELTEEQIEDNLITLDTSIRSYNEKCRLILSFNPPLETYWIFHWMKTYLNYNGKPITQAYKIATDVDGVKVDADCLIHHSTYKDNKWNFYVDEHGDADYKRPGQYAAKLERLKYTNPYKYRTECLGLPGTAGESVFNANKISKRIEDLQKIHGLNPPVLYDFSYNTDKQGLPMPETIKGFPSMIGEVIIYKMPNPKHPYVASFDTAGEGDDFYFMQVMDNITDEQVATFQSQKLADECIITIFGVLKMYNDAVVAPEVNFSEYPVMKLKEWGYTNIYQRESPKDDIHDTLERKLGFRTTSGNRQAILDNLIEWTKTNLDKIYDLETLTQMLTFTRQSRKNKGIFMGAEAGAHDDAVMALAILLKAKEQQSCEEQAEVKKIEGYWTRCELEAAVIKGRVDEYAAREYMSENKDRFQRDNKRRSRYAR
jgi:phage terminase large subunit